MKVLLTIIIGLFLTSCGFRATESEVVWRKGDSLKNYEKSVKEAEALEWKTENSTEFAGYKIDQKTQILNGREVLDTQSKKASDLKTNEPLVFAAQYKKKGFFPLLEDKSDPKKLLQQFIVKHSEMSSAKFEIPEPVFLQEGATLVSLWRATFQDKTQAGQVLFYKNLNIHSVKIISSQFDTHATIFPKGPKRSELTQVLLSELSELSKLSSPRVLVDSEAPGSELNLKEPLVYSPQDPKFDQVQAYYILDSSLKWFETKFGYKPYKKIEAVVHLSYPEKTNAAFYYAGKIRIGTGDDITYSHLAQDPSIVTHESAHSIIEAVAHLPFDGEGGSLNEGFADFFACVQLQNPYMGEAAYLQGPYKRSLLTVISFNEKDGGLYHDSLILSGLLWNFYQVLGENKSLKIASRLLVEMHSRSDLSDLKIMLPVVMEDVLEPGDLRKAKKIAEERGF